MLKKTGGKGHNFSICKKNLSTRDTNQIILKTITLRRNQKKANKSCDTDS